MCDIRFKKDFTYILVGPSRSGKTVHVSKLLKHQNLLFQSGQIKNTHYFYKEWQRLFDEMNDNNYVKEWHKEIPTLDKMKELAFPYQDKGGSLFIIDDFGQNLNRDIAELFTVLSHHMNISVIIQLQSLFNKNPVYREIQLSTQYISIFKNNRDKSQILHFARQFQPSNIKYVTSAYNEATKKPYTYMLFDLTQEIADNMRMRSSILPSEAPMLSWFPPNVGI